MKLRILLITTLLMTFLIRSIAFSEEKESISFDTPITLKVNDKFIKADAKPFLYRGLTYVPIRFAGGALGADHISWDEKARTAHITDDATEISLTIGKTTARINEKTVPVSGSIMLTNDRTYVPVRFVAEAFGAEVIWDDATYTVSINKDGNEVPPEYIGMPPFSDDDIYWLSRIVNAESGAEPMCGKIAVANTVLNRVKSNAFPNTIYGVIFDRKHGVQFEPTINGTIYKKPSGDSIIAAKRALLGENVVSKSMYFLNPKIATNFWIVNNRTFYKTIGNHDFYL